MAKWFAFGPLSVFAYQLVLAITGRDPMSVTDIIPTFVRVYAAYLAYMVKIAIT